MALAPKKKPDWTFEAGLTALEDISLRMEEGDLPLEEALRLYEEGKALQKRLIDQLDASEKRLVILEAGAKADEPTDTGHGLVQDEGAGNTDMQAGDAPFIPDAQAVKTPVKPHKNANPSAAQTMLEVEP